MSVVSWDLWYRVVKIVRNKLEPCCIDRAIVSSVRQARSLIIPAKTERLRSGHCGDSHRSGIIEIIIVIIRLVIIIIIIIIK